MPLPTASRSPNLVLETNSRPVSWYIKPMTSTPKFSPNRNNGEAIPNNSRSPLNKVTTDIYMIIQEYISSSDVRHLMNTSKLIFSDARKFLLYYNLNPVCSIRYCENEKFRSLILSKMMDKSKQLSLNLENSTCKNKYYYHSISHVHRLKLLEISHPLDQLENHFKGISELSFSLFSHLSSIDFLTNLRKLSLLDCRQVTIISTNFAKNSPNLQEVSIISCPQVIDIRGLANIPIVHIRDCPQITNFHLLGNHTTCSIIDCPTLSELSNFKNVKYLTIKNCGRIMNTNGLANVYSVTLIKLMNLMDISGCERNHSVHIESCEFLSDVSPLMNVPHVTIIKCTNLQEINMLCTLTTLSLSGCPRIRDISWLNNLQAINLYECNTISDLSVLRNMKTVTIYNCARIHDISVLGHVEYLSVGFCQYLSNINGLGKSDRQKVVKIKGCNNIGNFASLRHVPEVYLGYIKHSWKKVIKTLFHDGNYTIEQLTIEGCPKLKAVQYFHKVKKLTISFCPRLQIIQGLQQVEEVYLRNCCKLSDIQHGFGRDGGNSKVVLENCLKIVDVSGLKGVVNEVQILNCPQVKEVFSLANVKRVKVEASMNQSVKGIYLSKNVIIL